MPNRFKRFRASRYLECIAHSRGAYFSNFGILGSIASHGCASDVQISCCGLYKLGSSNVPAAMPCPKSLLPPNNREPHSAQKPRTLSPIISLVVPKYFGVPLGDLERVHRNVKNGSVRSASSFLAVATVTVERHNWFCGNFITNRATGAAAGNWFHIVGLELMKVFLE